MSNPILGQILQNALRGGMGGGAFGEGGGLPGGLGGGLGGAALGGILGGLMRGGSAGGGSGKRTVLMAMMLPIIMRWVQSNGGIGAVLDRFRQKGLGAQADSWVSTGQNHAISPQDVRQVVGSGELQSLASSLGVPEEDVAESFSQALPELTNQLTPDGHMPQHADQQLEQGTDALEQALGELHGDMQRMP